MLFDLYGTCTWIYHVDLMDLMDLLSERDSRSFCRRVRYQNHMTPDKNKTWINMNVGHAGKWNLVANYYVLQYYDEALWKFWTNEVVPWFIFQNTHKTLRTISMFASCLIDNTAHTCTKYRIIHFSTIPYIFHQKSSCVNPCYPPLKEIKPSNIPNRGPPKVLVRSTWILGHGESTLSITTLEAGGCMCWLFFSRALESKYTYFTTNPTIEKLTGTKNPNNFAIAC